MNTSNNILMALVTLATVAFAIEYFKPTQIIEPFAGMPSASMKVIRERVYENPVTKRGFYEVPGGFQSSLSPRAAGMVDYGAFIRYNQPDLKNLGVDPNQPLMAQQALSAQGCSCPQNNIVEGYCTRCGTVSGCRKGGQGTGTANLASPQVTKHSNLVQPGFEPQSAMKAQQKLDYTPVTDMLPVQDMSNGMMVNALGENVEQPIIYDRFIYANQKNRLREAGDPIRGDLPIVPLQKGWFSPSGGATPQLALRDGALSVMGGVNNTTSKELLALQNAATGGLENTGGGINYSVQKSSFLNSAQDLQVTAFP